MAGGNIPRAHPAEPASPRTRALVRRMAELDARHAEESGRIDAIALGLVDVLFDHDEAALRAALDALRDARGRRSATRPPPTGGRGCSARSTP